MTRTRLALCLMFALLVGCSSTRFESRWKDPQLTTLAFAKLLVVAPFPDGAIRRQAEDAMRAAITTMPVVTSYEAIASPEAFRDARSVIAAARQCGADGVVTLRLVADRTEITYAAGMGYPAAYHTMPGYWGPRYGLAPMAYMPPTVDMSRMVAVETCIYRIADGKLVWSGLTSTRDPLSITVLVKETAAVVRQRLRRDGLIPAQ